MTMYQKYGSDPTRNLLVDKVENTAIAYQRAIESLKRHDRLKEEANERVDPVR